MWDRDTYERFGRALKHWRTNRGLSAQALADKTSELGYPISRGVIANMETGRKSSLDVCELIVLASALRVDPPILLYPPLPIDEVEYLPHQPVSTDDALQRFMGTDESAGTPLRAWHDWRESTVRADRYRRHGNTEAAMEALDLADQARAQYREGL